MPKQKISEFNSNPALNTDIDSINLAEGCAPSGINDAIRELMAQLKDWQAGTSNDPMVIGSTGSLTLNQGTANGVAYLNGSKVVTSGSALTFNGTNFGVGVSPALARLHTSTNTATTADFTGSVRITNESYTSGTYAGVLFETADTLNSYVTGIRQGSYAGILAFGVNTGSSGTSLSEGMRLTSTGLGIGTSSPAYKLDVSATGTTVSSAFRSDQSQMWVMLKDSGTALGNVRIGSEAGSFIAYANGNQLVYNSSGNLGLGVTPSAWYSFSRAIDLGAGGAIQGRSNTAGTFELATNAYLNTSGNWTYKASSTAANLFAMSDGTYKWNTAASGTAGNAITFTQAMTLDASGNLLVNTTNNQGARVSVLGGAGQSGASFRVNANGDFAIAFNNASGSTVGYVQVNSTTTTYATSSDYRLKENIQPMTGALAKVAALKPVTYKWNADGSDGQGFIAHELAEVCPDAVTGEKDAVDAEGNPKYQGIDVSFLVATLTAAIQELNAKFEAYKATHP